jgi:drug/metabolite transporter (DMT)-like permease
MSDFAVNDAARLRSLRMILGDLVRDAQDLIRGELALARVEIDRKTQAAILALVWTFGGMFVAFAGLIVLLMAAVAALEYVIPAWAAALVIGVLILAIGGALTMMGVQKLKPSNLTPERTVESVSRDARMLKEHM